MLFSAEPTEGNMNRANIIDDDPDAIEALKLLLQDFSDIQVAGETTKMEDAFGLYNEINPELVFLDIDLGNGVTGFDLLDRINLNEQSWIIFVTAFDQYAIKAFNYAALDYLLKPVDSERLGQALDRFRQFKQSENIGAKVNQLLNFVKCEKVRFNTRTGFIYLCLEEIMYCKADRDYTEINLTDGRKELVTTNISNVLHQINQPDFIKIGRSHILNRKHIAGADRRKESCAMRFGDRIIEIPLSRKLIRELEEKLGQ